MSLTEPVAIKNNNQPMMVVTVSGGARTRWVIEQQVREARQEREDGGGGRSVTKPTTKEEGGVTMTGQTTINKQLGLRFAPFGQISNNILCQLIQCHNKRRQRREVGVQGLAAWLDQCQRSEEAEATKLGRKGGKGGELNAKNPHL
jgi:hypothetical protein